MAEIQTYRHPVTNRIKRTDREAYARQLGFEVYDGEIEVDKVGLQTASMTAEELRELAEKQGLPTSGSKAQLRQRIAEKAAEPEAPTTSSDSAGDTE